MLHHFSSIALLYVNDNKVCVPIPAFTLVGLPTNTNTIIASVLHSIIGIHLQWFTYLVFKQYYVDISVNV